VAAAWCTPELLAFGAPAVITDIDFDVRRGD
jgi:hypothetical protein